MKQLSYYLELALIGLALVLFTSNLFLKIPGYSGVEGGLYSDYLIPKIYLSDLVLTGLALVVGVRALIDRSWKKLRAKRKKLWLEIAAGWSIILVIQLASPLVLVGIFGWWRLTLAGLLGLLVKKHWSAWRSQFTFLVAANLLFQASLGLYQWLTQSSLAGYWLFGEPSLQTPIGLAKISLSGADQILPYATLPHPNVLGAVAALLTLIIARELTLGRTDDLKKRWGKILYQFCLAMIGGLGLVAVFLSQSSAASLTLVLGGLLLWLPATKLRLSAKQITLGVCLLLVSMVAAALLTYQIGITKPFEPSWYRRAYLLENSWQQIGELPPLGSGIGQATTITLSVIRAYEAARFNQPVHHVIALSLIELGLIGGGLSLSLASLIFWHLSLKAKHQLLIGLIILSPLIIWDHFIWSLPQGQLISAIFLGYLITKEKSFQELN